MKLLTASVGCGTALSSGTPAAPAVPTEPPIAPPATGALPALPAKVPPTAWPEPPSALTSLPPLPAAATLLGDELPQASALVTPSESSVTDAKRNSERLRRTLSSLLFGASLASNVQRCVHKKRAQRRAG